METLISANDDAVPALAELGFVQAEAAAGDAKKEGYAEGLAAGLAQAKEILDVAALGEAPVSLAATMVAEGLSQEAAVAAVQQHRANLSAEQTVNSTITTMSGDGKHPLVAACEKMATA